MSTTANKKKGGGEDSKEEVFASCTFLYLGLHPSLCDQLRDKMGFEGPTHIQAQAILVILSGRHVCECGYGYRQDYYVSSSHHSSPFRCAIFELIATVELLVYEILQKLLHRFHWIVPGYVMGGENRSKEKARLRKGISILIATPGRLLDHLKNTSSFAYTNLRWIIFDEADRILELGFGKEIEEILDHLGSRQIGSVDEKNAVLTCSKSQRQNLLLSATLDEKVNHLANISLENPVVIGLDEKKNLVNPSTKHLRLIESDVDGEPERMVTQYQQVPMQTIMFQLS